MGRRGKGREGKGREGKGGEGKERREGRKGTMQYGMARVN